MWNNYIKHKTNITYYEILILFLPAETVINTFKFIECNFIYLFIIIFDKYNVYIINYNININ